MLSQLDRIKKAKTATNSTRLFSLDELTHGVHLGEFFRYKGGLTTPPCSEIVIWTVFRKATIITIDQLHKLSTIEDKYGNPMKQNFRKTQPLKGRKVYKFKSGGGN